MIKLDESTVTKIKNFVLEGIDIHNNRIAAESDPFWQALVNTGTEPWLDTGDIDEASKIWKKEMTALTTNNTLLNMEIQKGIYDDLIKDANEYIKELDIKQRIIEIAFILNARHGLRLVEKFGGKVSVELHTDLAHNLEGIVYYGKRLHDICPDYFVIKVPLTATGLLGARKLREENIAVNFTLGFSARQNVLIASIVKPDYLNVFLGRLNAYIINNKLGDGENVGEKATIASQKIVHDITRDNTVPTKQIAASMRDGKQLATLAGIDVFTIPTKVAQQGLETLDGNFTSRVDENYPVTLNPGINEADIQLNKIWDTSEAELNLANSLDKEVPSSGEELVERAHQMGCVDIFPKLSDEDLKVLDEDGKIPVHEKWHERIKAGELAIDTLLNIAGLASFAADQAALDARIEGLIN
jgi:transaldolase